MLRSTRLEPVLDVAANTEKIAAVAFAAAEARVLEAEKKLVELERYEQEYRAALHARTTTGIDASQLRTFHGFISRLGDAIAQQGVALGRARDERDVLRQRWLEASRRAQAVGKVIEHASNEERRVVERREQHDSDERAQRAHTAAEQVRRETVRTQTSEES
jgi:flagellar FliJ protein